jgi:hypothetical protein
VLQQLVHGAPLAYLDNGATTQMPLAVLDAMRQFETHDRANIHRGVHTLSQRATDDFEAARATLKRFIGAGPSTSWCSPPAPPKRSTDRPRPVAGRPQKPGCAPATRSSSAAWSTTPT